ncbi:MAG: TrbI/VirB10 family protein [Limisphaerales bacterium]
MNATSFIAFLRARILLVGVLIGLVLAIAFLTRTRPPTRPSQLPFEALTNPPPTRSVVRESVPLTAYSPKPPPPPVNKSNPPLPGLHIHVPLPTATNPPTLGLYAPAGRLIRAITVNALNSASIDTPIIALVTDDLWHGGELVIPAGSELHGRAALDRTRDRIVSTGPWTIVWQTGEELTVTGIALDREDPVLRTGKLDGDGVAGLKGQIIRSDSAEEIRLFAAAFLSGAASGFQQRQTTLLGTEILGNARNAGLNGASQVLNTYAQQITDSIRRDGIFVAVPAGHPMYLYVTHTLDLGQARIGNLRTAAIAPPALLKTPNAP